MEGVEEEVEGEAAETEARNTDSDVCKSAPAVAIAQLNVEMLGATFSLKISFICRNIFLASFSFQKHSCNH